MGVFLRGGKRRDRLPQTQDEFASKEGRARQFSEEEPVWEEEEKGRIARRRTRLNFLGCDSPPEGGRGKGPASPAGAACLSPPPLPAPWRSRDTDTDTQPAVPSCPPPRAFGPPPLGNRLLWRLRWERGQETGDTRRRSPPPPVFPPPAPGLPSQLQSPASRRLLSGGGGGGADKERKCRP